MIPDEAPELRAVQNRFAVYPGRYWIAGGWAVDLHIGCVRRDHHDVDVLISHAICICSMRRSVRER
jgi:hypothetical protein